MNDDAGSAEVTANRQPQNRSHSRQVKLACKYLQSYEDWVLFLSSEWRFTCDEFGSFGSQAPVINQEFRMLAKCANPVCSRPFRRLSEGKLFLVESGNRHDDELEVVRNKPSHHIEYFWLCEECARSVTLTFDSRRGICAVPLPAGETTNSSPGEVARKSSSPAQAAAYRVQAAATR